MYSLLHIQISEAHANWGELCRPQLAVSSQILALPVE